MMTLVSAVRSVSKVEEREAPPRGLVAELLGPLPGRQRPLPGARALQAALVWGDDHLVDLVEVPEGRPFVIGPGEDATLKVAHEVTFGGPIELARLGPDGLSVLCPVLAQGRVFGEAGDAGSLELLEKGRAVPTREPVDGVRFVLGDDERAVLRFGNLRLVLRVVRPARRPFRLDPAQATRIALYVLVGLTAGGMLQRTDWVPDPVVDDSRFALGPIGD